MKTYSLNFINGIKELGRQQNIIMTYKNSNNENVTINNDDINNISVHYDGALLKSMMKCLEFEYKDTLDNKTEIELKYGIYDESNDNYGYVSFGKFYVYKSEKQEADRNYKIICYDAMINAMINYDNVVISVNWQNGVSIYTYLYLICKKIGLRLNSTPFANADRRMTADIYKNIDYTVRDIFDEISAAAGGSLCINANNELQMKYPTIGSVHTINEEYLKDINVDFGQKYGPINSVVLSRSGESDNVYLRDDDSIEQNGLCEVKIVDNQIMNFNDRSDYLPELLDKLLGVEYYINDYNSTGIVFLDYMDTYTVSIENKRYKCLMLNDEVNITEGLEEIIYTKMPEETETEYDKADKTDRKINKTYLIVDKQNQRIDAVISNVTAQDEKIAQISLTVDELNSRISDISDITTSQESNLAKVELKKVEASEPVTIRVRPTGVNISYLYPRDNLYPSDTLYMPDRIIKFRNTTTNEVFTYEIPMNLLYYNDTYYDEFYLDYDSQKCQVIKKVDYNADGTVKLIGGQTTYNFFYPKINLTAGDYVVELPGYNTAYLFVRLMAQNQYTSMYATKAELASEISQTKEEINLDVDAKFSNYSTTTEMNSAIVLKANEITSRVSETYETKNDADDSYTTLNQKYSEVDQKADSISTTVAEVSGRVANNTRNISTLEQTATSISATVENNDTKAHIIAKINDNTSSIQINADAIDIDANDVLNILAGNTINLTSKNIAIKSNNFEVTAQGILKTVDAILKGSLESNDATITGGKITLQDNGSASGSSLTLNSSSYNTTFWSSGISMTPRYSSDNGAIFNPQTVQIYHKNYSGEADRGIILMNYANDMSVEVFEGNVGTFVQPDGVFPMSIAESKKNFELYNNALDIIDNIDIYRYNYINEEDTDKKHLGFCIGKDFNYSNLVTSKDNKKVDLYSFNSLCCQAIKELYKLFKELKGERNGKVNC